MLMAEEYRDKTTFVTHRGAFRWLRMTFRLLNPPATFQRSLDIILSRVRLKTSLVYLDYALNFYTKAQRPYHTRGRSPHTVIERKCFVEDP